MPPPYSGVALSEKINALITEWGIVKKLFSITLDNASTNTSFVEILTNQLNFRGLLLMSGKFFHVRCCAHILNLIVQDGLKEIDSSVIKIRECIKYIKGSEGRKQKFYECVAQVGIMGSKKGLRQDVPTRWNSTYTMLESALFYHRAFINLGLIDSNFSSCASTQEWIKLEKITKFLGYFYDVTCLFSRTKYPTSNLFFPKVFIIQHQIKAAMEDNDGFMNKMGTNMNMKFEKYWSEYSLILAIAIIFVISCILWSVLIPSFMDFDNSYKNGPSTSRKNELHKYLDEERLDRKQDIHVLSWWQMEHFHYPILSNLARDVLTIHISMVASESAFSVGGRVLDQYCSSLLPEIVQALLCTRAWLFGKGAMEEENATVESLTEDIFKLTCQDTRSRQSSNSISLED
ncbi:PREDICTED: zinc finger BED domain-containing protein RICESLEEPER 2-like [Prunus mume]|uniref:Zinc finger BED domain-containing protein RICESLEEPER 2-like n=1 Tax=Prunus mume TaxID=102107 RepID=A0ABM1LQJ8_PRUMU|nr:PREDICTED: zinc finger BED domain-containing protein RICESLEEPER 2-like [Prunus mume]